MSLNPQQFGKVAVLMGGPSSEHEVSLTSGEAVVKALLAEGVDAVAIRLSPEQSLLELVELLPQLGVDRVFNMLHGGPGENGALSALMAMLGLPVTGSNMMASSLAMDKVQSKRIWQGLGLPTADYMLLQGSFNEAEVLARLGLPLFIKPACEGSSIGMTKVEVEEQLWPAVEAAYELDARVLAEQWIAGAEYTVAIVNGEALPAIKLETDRGFYDYQAKYVDDDTRYLIPCGLDGEREQALQELALQAFNSLGCRNWGRVDVMADADGQFQLLEVNTVPGMTSHSLVPMAAKAAGMSFGDLVLAILAGIELEDAQ